MPKVLQGGRTKSRIGLLHCYVVLLVKHIALRSDQSYILLYSSSDSYFGLHPHLSDFVFYSHTGHEYGETVLLVCCTVLQHFLSGILVYSTTYQLYCYIPTGQLDCCKVQQLTSKIFAVKLRKLGTFHHIYIE